VRATPEGKRAAWPEFFFDLVYVFSFTQVARLLQARDDWRYLGLAVVVLVPLYWGWVGTSIYANRRDVENARDTLGIFAIGLCSLGMALAVPGVTGTRGALFGCSYFLLRIALALLAFPDYRGARRNPYTSGAVVSGPLLLVGGFVPGPARVVLWAVAGVADLSAPFVFRRTLGRIRYDTTHLSERFGLLVIIALGVSLVQIGGRAAEQPLGPARLVAVAAAYALVGSLWWAYFVVAIRGLRQVLSGAEVQIEVIRPALSYGHLPIIGGIIAVIVGLAEVVSAPTGQLRSHAALLLTGGCALYLAAFGFIRWRLARSLGWLRLGAAAACLCVLPIAPFMPANAVLLTLLGITAALNLFEGLQVRRGGLGRVVDVGRRPRKS
jgi:low temperature requirement protein LtrA